MTIATGQLVSAPDVLAALALNLPLTGGVLSGPLTLAGDPSASLQAVTKQYVDSINTTLTTALNSVVPAGALLKAGGTMTGALTLAGDPTAALQATTKQYVDAAVAILTTAASTAQTKANAALPLAGGTTTGPIILSANPSAALGAATKQYVDAINTTLLGLISTAQSSANAALPLAGGTMTGAVTLAADPVAVLQAASKRYVDAADAILTTAAAAAQTKANAAVPLVGGTMSGALVLSGDPTVPLGAATRQYVDAGGLIVSNVYTAAGAISSSDAFAVIESATSIVMTLGGGVNGHSIRINNVGPATVSVSGSFQVATGVTYQLPPGSVLAASYSTVVTIPSWLLTSTVSGGTQASAITVDTPPQALPSSALTVTGTLQGTPSGLQYQIDAGAWTAAVSPVITPNSSFSFAIGGGISAAGGHTIGVRDANTPTTLGVSGNFVVSAFNPSTVSTGTVVWVFDSNDSLLVNANAATTNVTTVSNRLHTGQLLTATSGASHTPVLWQRGLGLDGKHRLIRMSPSIQAPGDVDPGANYFTAGGLGGSAAALVTALNLPSGATVGSWTIGWAGYCDFTSPGFQFWAGPSWINIPLFGGASQWVQIRWNQGPGNVNGQIADAGGIGSNASTTPPTNGYYVWALVKNASALTLYLNAVSVGTFTIVSTNTFTAADFMFGGGINADGTSETGNPPTSWGGLQVYAGALAGADLTGMQQMLASSVGLTVAAGGTTFASAITVDTPPQALPSTSFTVTGTVVGVPTALQYSLNGGAWIAAPSPTITANVGFSFTVSAGLIAGTYVIGVRDTNATTISGVSGSMVVAAFNPNTVSTGTVVWVFDSNDPAQVALDGTGAVATIANKLAPTRLLNAVSATNGVKIQWLRAQGADGARRLLAMSPTTQDNTIYDPQANWFSAGGLGGSANTLIQAFNASNLSTNSFTTSFAAYLDTSGTWAYMSGPIWGQGSTPGPLQRIVGGRWAGYASTILGLVMDGAGAGGTATLATPPSSEWCVITFIKNLNALTLRINGAVVATATNTSTASFTSLNFLLGGGFGVPAENGFPFPFYGGFQVYTGALSGVDLTGMEKMLGNSVGLVL